MFKVGTMLKAREVRLSRKKPPYHPALIPGTRKHLKGRAPHAFGLAPWTSACRLWIYRIRRISLDRMRVLQGHGVGAVQDDPAADTDAECKEKTRAYSPRLARAVQTLALPFTRRRNSNQSRPRLTGRKPARLGAAQTPCAVR
jgi:hypothetical protein